MTPRLDPPHDALLAAAEAAAMLGFDALARREDVTEPRELGAWLEQADARAPLRRIVDGFQLDPRATALLALLFAVELSEPVARHVTRIAAGGGRGIPFWLARRLIPELRADALAAAGPLRRFGLIGVEEGAARIEARVWLREAVLDRLCGAPPHEPEVAARIAPLAVNEALVDPALARALKAALGSRGRDHLSPVALAGPCEPAMVAASVASLGLAPHLLAAANIPEDPDARDRLARHWSRDAALDAAALIVAADERAEQRLTDFIDRVTGHVVVTGPLAATNLRRDIRIIGGIAAAPSNLIDRWRRALGGARAGKLGAAVARVAAQFRLQPAEIDAVCARVAADLDEAPNAEAAERIVWRAAGRASLAVPVPGVSIVEPAYGWRDIVLAPPVEAALRRIEAHVRHATTVMDDWGFAERMGGRGRGVAALFSGPSGTGKTMAAEVLASSLDLRMIIIDLSQIISKYIGETSKNIAAAFDQAERSGAVMVWNEGDAIWGARGAVGNATDRHVNAEIGDLLQRIEAFRGFTIVTTNARQAIDPAFLRRFRFAIDFPLPSEGERLRLWRQAFPDRAPIDAVDWTALAALPLSGGSIRNIALGSAFLAAEGGRRIDRGLISAEFAEELRKHNLPVPAIDWRMQ
jgi:ATPase family protein associated with various cellular activities (AAA)